MGNFYDLNERKLQKISVDGTVDESYNQEEALFGIDPVHFKSVPPKRLLSVPHLATRGRHIIWLLYDTVHSTTTLY